MRQLRRSWTLLQKFRNEQADPRDFYTFLAEDTVHQLARYTELRHRLVLDVGGGPGYMADALARAGARCLTVDVDYDELFLHGRQPRFAVVGDGLRLPLRDASIDVCYSSNVLEHVKNPGQMLDQLIRVIRPGGLLYLSFTNWYSPWGGHETSPWHYFGGDRAAARYERRYGREPKNRFGHNLFPLHVSEVLAWTRQRADVETVDAAPRYYPTWCRWIVAVPGLREVATWNLALVLRRRG